MKDFSKELYSLTLDIGLTLITVSQILPVYSTEMAQKVDKNHDLIRGVWRLFRLHTLEGLSTASIGCKSFLLLVLLLPRLLVRDVAS